MYSHPLPKERGPPYGCQGMAIIPLGAYSCLLVSRFQVRSVVEPGLPV